MAENDKYQFIIDKINSGMQFGIFERSMKCYFSDGTNVGYNDIWKAVKTMNGIDGPTNKTLAQLCPNNYVGSFNYPNTKHRWKK